MNHITECLEAGVDGIDLRVANHCGSQNVPVVAVSVGLALKKEVERQSPYCEFAMVKEALGSTLVKSVTHKVSCRLISDAATGCI